MSLSVCIESVAVKDIFIYLKEGGGRYLKSIRASGLTFNFLNLFRKERRRKSVRKKNRGKRKAWKEPKQKGVSRLPSRRRLREGRSRCLKP